MGWRDTISRQSWRESIKKDWRKSIKGPRKQTSLKAINDQLKQEIVKELTPKQVWKKTVAIEPIQPKDGKDFVFAEHEAQIKAILEKLVLDNKLKFSDLTDEEKAQLKGEKGDTPKVSSYKPKDGSDGKNGTEWHIVKGKPDEDLGVIGDMALDMNTSSIYKKNDSWELQGKLKANVVQNVSGVTSYDIEDITKPATVTVDTNQFLEFEITTQDFIRVIGNNPLTIYLPNPASYKKRLTIKNLTQSVVTVVQRNSTVNDQVSLEIPEMGDGLGNSIDLLPDSEQFWIK